MNGLLEVDFAALKKAMPAHSAVLDSLQKQYESVKIPYGEVPKEFNQVCYFNSVFGITFIFRK